MIFVESWHKPCGFQQKWPRSDSILGLCFAGKYADMQDYGAVNLE
jgi:hypothetical protein